MTANKSQGQTLKKVGINATNDFFSHGQLYVAMSRCGSADGLKIFKPKEAKNEQYIKNVVYPEALQWRLTLITKSEAELFTRKTFIFLC